MSRIEKRELIKAGAIYTIANVLLKGISFFTIPIFIRLLTPEEFGRFNVFISFEAVIYMFCGLTLHASIKNAFYDKREDYEGYVKNCVYVDLIVSLFIAIAFNIICLFASEQIDMSFAEINLLVVSGLCSAIISLYGSKLVMEYKAGDYAFMSFLSIVTGIIISLFLIYTFFDFDHYLGRIVGLVIGHLIAALYALYKIFETGLSPIVKEYWKYGAKISLPIIPHGLSQVILSFSNRILIKYFYNAALAGVFSFTYTVSMVPQVLFQSVSSVWEPWFFERMNSNDIKQIMQKSTMFCLLISLVFIMMSCVTPEIIIFLATDDYLDAIDISIVVLMGCYFATLYYIPCEVEYFFKKTKHIAISTCICALINIGLNLFLMQFFSYKVAAYVTLFAYFLYFVFHMFMSYYICKKWIFELEKIIIIIICSILLMTAILVFKDYIIVRWVIFTIFAISILIKKEMIINIVKEVRLRK